MRRRRVWSELLPLAEVRSPAVLRLLSRYGLELCVAVRPETLAELPALCRAAAGAGVPVAIWPMIADEAGRWASAGNAPVFCAFVDEVLGALAAEGLETREVIFDMEPPLPVVRRALAGADGLWKLLRRADAGTDAGADAGAGAGADAGAGAGAGAGADAGAGAGAGAGADAGPSAEDTGAGYREFVARLDAREISTTAAIVPFLLRDGRERGWEQTLGTPVSRVGFRGIHAMLYTSMLEGWSRGLLRRADGLSLLGWGCRAARRRFGEAAGVSLGVVGVGALGDEPIYGGVGDLREDVATARAAGIEDLALFDLGGVLSRPPAEAWLEALTATPPGRAGRLTLRARGALAALDLAQSARGARLPW